MSNRHFLYVALTLVLLGAITVVLPFVMTPRKPTKERKQLFEAKKAIDGNTIELANGQKVRLIGIDASEIAQASCFSEEAKEYNDSLIRGKLVEMEKDVSERDKFGRLLRYIYVDGKMVNETLVREGYAQAMRISPDVKFAGKLEDIEQEARRQGKGLWSACQVTVVSGQVLGLEATESAK